MKNTLFLLLLITLIPVFTGCATHKHERPIFSNNGEFVGYEKTKWKYFAVDSKAAQVSLEVKDLNYHRKVSASDAEVFADEEAVKQLAEGISKAVASTVLESIKTIP